MKIGKKKARDEFQHEAERVLALPIAHPVNRLGGYGPNLEVIYQAHPLNCPSVLADSKGNATVTFMSNGSVGFNVKLAEGMDIAVLDGSFDISEKHESRVPSQNVWLELAGGRARGPGGARHIASLINPRVNVDCDPASVRIVKLGDPNRAMWYCATFGPAPGVRCETAVRFSLVATARGPALLREVFVRNTGRKPLAGQLWAWFHLHGTQRFVYNKELWYDVGLPVTPTETVICATVPYSDILQIKRVSSLAENLKPVDATCDYATFIGDSAVPSVLPDAVRAGKLLPGGAGSRMNRFSTPTIAAGQFAFKLAPGRSATLRQSVLYVTDRALIDRFRNTSAARTPTYKDMSRAFLAAAREIIHATPSIGQSAPKASAAADGGHPHFEVALPAEPAVTAYANSVWIGVPELYENCRAHGAKLASGIELGTRDRAQDMWPKMKEDPGRVRSDLVHAMSMMYVICEKTPTGDHSLTLGEKLHGMFPRQYPSRWDDRRQEIFNDNRPYNDSALWLLNSINMYLRETGDASILLEKVQTVRLTRPDQPETSGLVGCDRAFAVAEVMMEVLECLRRHAADTPYGMAQMLYGDWCDPIDMYGTSVVGDPKTRGRGKGVQARLSAHLFLTLVETIDAFETPLVARTVAGLNVRPRIEALKGFAGTLRQNVVKVAWEDGPGEFPAGFVSAIHELRADGSRPNYAAGEIGYTLGSMKGKDFDGANRRDLGAQSYGLAMLNTRRDWVAPVAGGEEMIRRLLRTINTLFFRPKLGLLLFTTPIGNNKLARDLVGRMGVVPAGTAENGEYHHGQAMMHRFRLDVQGLASQADAAWGQFKPMMSVMRDESLAGPFETPCTSYASDVDDPHFGKGMYFGLSGSVDWIVEIFHKIAGLELALHDERRPAVAVNPTLPAELRDQLTFKRVIHCALPSGGYRPIPLTINIRSEGKGKRLLQTRATLNGKSIAKAEVASLAEVQRIDMELVRVYE